MNINQFNEAFRRSFSNLPTSKSEQQQLKDYIIESVNRAKQISPNHYTNNSSFERIITESIEAQTGKHWWEVVNGNISQILFEETNVESAVDKIVKLCEDYYNEADTNKKNVYYVITMERNRDSFDVYAGTDKNKAIEAIERDVSYMTKSERDRFIKGDVEFLVAVGKIDGIEDEKDEISDFIDSVYASGNFDYGVTIDKDGNIDFGRFLDNNESLSEDTEKTSKGKWVNKGEKGTHGTFRTKKEADAQRKAMFASGYKESIEEDYNDDPNLYQEIFNVFDDISYMMTDTEGWADEDWTSDSIKNIIVTLEDRLSTLKKLNKELQDRQD